MSDDQPKDRFYRPVVLICMGVSGSGKTTVALAIDAYLGWPFQEGDELHPPGNVEKMRHSIPLSDEDRWPWLASCKAWIDERLAADGRGLITCSALKRSYRDFLVDGRTDRVRIIYLKSDRQVLAERLNRRQGHYMPPTLLESQLATLEEPTPDEHPIIVSPDRPPAETIEEILSHLRRIDGARPA